MKYKELREKVQNLEKYPGCVKIDRSPLIHKGFPGTFNLSFTEHPWLEEHGKYADFDHDYVFSTIQSCIRLNDFPLMGSSDSWKYLGVFEMADLFGMVSLKDRSNSVDLQRKQTKALFKLFEDLGISKNSIYPSYQAGGKVKEIINGKYDFDFNITKDIISKQVFLEQGVPEENLISDTSRLTFLATNLYKSIPEEKGAIPILTPWGYRSEINVNISTKESPKYIDVATIQRFLWKPISNSGQTTGLDEIDDEVSIAATGLERLCMVANDLQKVQDVDYIKPFYEVLGKEQISCGESLRALHRIYSDMKKFKTPSLSRNRKPKIRKLLQNIPRDLTLDKIKDLLQIHSETQPWHSELKEGIEPTIERIKVYRNLKTNSQMFSRR